jgi:methyl-accepting chemotaxis protein
VDQVAAAILEITGEATSIRTLVDEVNLGSQEQARGIEHIGKAISQMEQVTQKTAANAEESASAAEELTAQSEALKDVVERLTAMVGGGGPVNRRARSGQRRADAAKPKSRHGGTESASAVSALRNPVPRQWNSADYPAPAGKEAFPLEEQFKEF